MKSMIVLALTLFSMNSFAQGPGRPGGYDPGTKGNPYGQGQYVEVQPGSATLIQVSVPTTVYCKGNVLQTDPALRCEIFKGSNYNGTYWLVKQGTKELSGARNTMESAIQDLNALRAAGICY